MQSSSSSTDAKRDSSISSNPVPKIVLNNESVQHILREMDKIKRSSRAKKIAKCESLILFMVCSVRKKQADHLLQTTIIWALVNILKINVNLIRNLMLQAGVPVILSEILRGRNLTRTVQEYASELCTFLWFVTPYAYSQ